MYQRNISWLVVALACSLPVIGRAGYWINGTYIAKCTKCNLDAGGLGNVKKNPSFIGCEVSPVAGTDHVFGLALCQNLGGNKPPGLEPASVDISFGATAQINNQHNGEYATELTATVPDNVLSQLVTACPNSNYSVTDFIPCGMLATANVWDLNGNSASQHMLCTMDGTIAVGADGTFVAGSVPTSMDTCTMTYNKKTGTVDPKNYTCCPTSDGATCCATRDNITCCAIDPTTGSCY